MKNDMNRRVRYVVMDVEHVKPLDAEARLRLSAWIQKGALISTEDGVHVYIDIRLMN